MNLQTLFYILGIVFFLIFLTLIIGTTVFFLIYYFRFKRQLNRLKDRSAAFVSYIKRSPFIASIMLPLLGVAAKKIGKKLHRKKD